METIYIYIQDILKYYLQESVWVGGLTDGQWVGGKCVNGCMDG